MRIAQAIQTGAGQNYAKEDYIKQFTIRVPENLAKNWTSIAVLPGKCHWHTIRAIRSAILQRQRLMEAKEKYGEYISPESFEKGD